MTSSTPKTRQHAKYGKISEISSLIRISVYPDSESRRPANEFQGFDVSWFKVERRQNEVKRNLFIL